MGWVQNAQLGAAGQANNLARKQLKELQRQARAPQTNNYPAPILEPARPQQDAVLATELQRLNESAASIASSLAALVQILGPEKPPTDQA